MIILFTFCRW